MSVVSIIIPAKNEAKNIGSTIEGIREAFKKEKIAYDIIVINDGSSDGTGKVIKYMADEDPNVRIVRNREPFGFGSAIKKGLEEYRGDMAIIAMADASDSPEDMIRYVREVWAGADCCFGTRWCKEAKVEGYPLLKYILNRTVNTLLNFLFGLHYNDTTNAFKCYSRQAIQGIKPLISRHFNITVEMPLKAVVRGYSYKVIPVGWHERKKGVSKLKIQEMGSRYLFIVLYVWLEKHLSRGDYVRGEEREGQSTS